MKNTFQKFPKITKKFPKIPKKIFQNLCNQLLHTTKFYYIDLLLNNINILIQ